MNKRASILIGSDEPAVVDTLRLLLTTAAQDGKAFEFTTSSRADDFIQQARSGRYDLAILHANCLVPTRPFTLLEQAVLAVRNIKAFRSVRLVVLTTMEEWDSPLRASGADVCLKAPFDANEILAAVL